MKKQILTVTVGLLSLCAFAQKDEIKLIEKALKKKDFKAAKATIKTLEATEASMDPKYKGKYLFLKGQAFGGSNVSKSAAAYRQLFKFENKTGKRKFTALARPMLKKLVASTTNKAINSYNTKDYKKAAIQFYQVYDLNPKDTTSLYNAATSATLNKDNDKALKYYEKLKDLNYTGISTEYYAINAASGVKENFKSDKKERDRRVKLGINNTPTQFTSTSKKADIVKRLAFIYVDKGQPEQAIAALQEARKQNPKDVNLIMNEAQMYIKLDKMDKFGELMEDAIKLQPNNPSLFFNLGVVNQNQKRLEKAKEYYQKAIDLKPDYRDAVLNYGLTVLANEQAIVDEMNKNLSNDKKYDALRAQQKQLYKDAIPYFEKADKLERNIDSVRILLNMYDTLGMTAKADALRPVYKELRGK